MCSLQNLRRSTASLMDQAKDLNSYNILGFSDSADGKISLTPIKGTRRILLYVKNNDTFIPVTIQQPQRDCNKVYATIRAMATQLFTILPEGIEDMGIAEEDVVNENLYVSVSEESVNKWTDLLCASWTEKESIGEKTKIAFVIKSQDGSWGIFALKAPSTFPANLLSLLATPEIEKATHILPVLEPLRQVVSNHGVVFVG